MNEGAEEKLEFKGQRRASMAAIAIAMLDQPAFNRKRLKAEKLIDSKVLEQPASKWTRAALVVAKFGYEIGGVAGAVLPVAAFLGIEAYLFWATRPSPGTWNTLAGG